MASIPDLYSPYYEPNGYEVSQRMDTFYQECITTNQSQWAEADLDTRFQVGDQSVWSELYGAQTPVRHKQYQFNRIQRVTNNIDGYQRRNRKSIIVTPIENGDQQTADQFTKIIMWSAQKEQMLETISDSFRHGALITGMNLLHLWMDYREDPISGNLKLDNCAANSFIVDPYFRKADFSDCNGIWKRTYLTKIEVISLLPHMKKEIEGLSNYDARDGKFQFMPENYAYDKKKLYAYDEYWYRDYRTQKMIVDVETGETMEWKIDDKDKLDEFLRIYPQLQVIDQEIPTVKLAIRVQNKVLYDGPNPMGVDHYPFVPVMGYFNPQMPYYPYRIQGVVRNLRDAQYLYNRRRIIELDILESQINSGWKYKENALVNPNDVFNLTGQGKGLALKEEAQMTDVEQIQPPQVPPSMIQLSELLAKEVQEISGVNEELLGSAVDDKAGILSMLRQGAGLTTLQILFDQLDRSQKQLGNLMIKYIQANFTPGKIKRIIEQEPAPEFYNKAFGMYDAAVEDGLNTTTQRQLAFAQALQLKEVEPSIPSSFIISKSTLQDKNELVQIMQQQEQQQSQAQQQQLQSQLQEQQARTQLAQARTVADQGLGMERISRIEENQALAVERRSEAEKDHYAGLLNLVKSLKEIDSVDLDQLIKLVQLANISKQNENFAESSPGSVNRGSNNNLASLFR
jgi:hypothetical protein